MKIYNINDGSLIGDFDIRPGGDVSGKDLTFANLSNLDLTGMNMSNAKFYGTSFEDSNLTNVNFRGSLFQGSSFWNTTIINTNFKDAKFDNIILSRLVISNSKFNSSEWHDSVFFESVLYGCDFNKASWSDNRESPMSTIRGSFIKDCDFTENKFNIINMEIFNNIIINTRFNRSDFNCRTLTLKGCDLYNVDFISVKTVPNRYGKKSFYINSSKLCGVDFTAFVGYVSSQESSFSHVSFLRAEATLLFGGATFSNMNFSNIKNSNFGFFSCDLSNMLFKETNLSTSKFIDTNCSNVDFSNSNLTEAVFCRSDLKDAITYKTNLTDIRIEDCENTESF